MRAGGRGRRRRRRQRILVARGVAVAQLQAIPVHGLPGGQAHVTAARPPIAAAQRDGQLVRRVLLDAHQLVHRAAVDGQRAAGARSRRVPVPVGAGRVDVRPRATGGRAARVARALRPQAPPAPGAVSSPAAAPPPPRRRWRRRRRQQAAAPAAAHRAHQRRQHRAGAAPGPQLLRDRRPRGGVRGGRPRGAVLVLHRGGRVLHGARARRGQLRAVRGRAVRDRRQGARRPVRAHRHHRGAVPRRGGQGAPGAAGVPVPRARPGRRGRARRPGRGVPAVRGGRAARAQAPARPVQGGHRQAVRQRVVPRRPALHRQRGRGRVQGAPRPAPAAGQAQVAHAARPGVARLPVAAGAVLSGLVLHHVHHGAPRPRRRQRDVRRGRGQRGLHVVPRPRPGAARWRRRPVLRAQPAARRLGDALRVRDARVRRHRRVHAVRDARPDRGARRLSGRRARHVRVVPQQLRARAVPAGAVRRGPRGARGAGDHRPVLRDRAGVRDGTAAGGRGRHLRHGQAAAAHRGHAPGNGVRAQGPAAVFRVLQPAADHGIREQRAAGRRRQGRAVRRPQEQAHYVLTAGDRAVVCLHRPPSLVQSPFNLFLFFSLLLSLLLVVVDIKCVFCLTF